MISNKFEILHTDGDCPARLGTLTTGHGQVRTPAFMPIGTAGAVKGITPAQLEQAGADIILANTYHLFLRPGIEIIRELGGLHRFMAWNKPILTDSGGYQIFSLSKLVKINDDGVEFTNHIDGKKFHLTAQTAIEIQNRLGADIIMCLDQCTPFPCEPALLENAVKRTVRWAAECKKTHKNDKQMLFGIIQGSTELEIRSCCASELVKMNFDGYAIGGLSVGEGHRNMVKTVRHTARLLPEDKPRYLMGAGTPADIIAAVRAGVDMFDCVLPTRNGRNAFAFTENGPVRLRNSVHINDSAPVEENCDCYCCRNFSRAAIRHFFNVKEMLGPILLSLHNIRFYQRLMIKIRNQIKQDRFDEWAEMQLKKYRLHYNTAVHTAGKVQD